MLVSSCYLETSFLVKGYLAEDGSSQVAGYIRNADNLLLISCLTNVEMATTLARQLELVEAQRIFAIYSEDCDLGVYNQVAVTADIWLRAQSLAVRQVGTPFLRSLDLLYIAIAIHHRADLFATYDGKLATAASRLGLAVVGVRP